MTLIRNDFEFEDKSCCIGDPIGRFIILNATVEGNIIEKHATCNYQHNSIHSNSAQLHLNGNMCIDKAISKNIYREVRSQVEIIATTQLKYSEKYNTGNQLDWKKI